MTYSEQHAIHLSAALAALITAIHDTLGACRFEGTTFRSAGPAVLVIRRAAERLAGKSLLREQLSRAPDGVLFGRLTDGAYCVFLTREMWSTRPDLLRE